MDVRSCFPSPGRFLNAKCKFTLCWEGQENFHASIFQRSWSESKRSFLERKFSCVLNIQLSWRRSGVKLLLGWGGGREIMGVTRGVNNGRRELRAKGTTWVAQKSVSSPSTRQWTLVSTVDILQLQLVQKRKSIYIYIFFLRFFCWLNFHLVRAKPSTFAKLSSFAMLFCWPNLCEKRICTVCAVGPNTFKWDCNFGAVPRDNSDIASEQWPIFSRHCSMFCSLVAISVSSLQLFYTNLICVYLAIIANELSEEDSDCWFCPDMQKRFFCRLVSGQTYSAVQKWAYTCLRDKKSHFEVTFSVVKCIFFC